MANHFRLYGRPLVVDEVASTLSVTGELEGYTEGEAYQSRLSINNSIGRCTVKILESTLPPGAVVRVDNITKEVVVKWAAYTEVVEEETLVPNGDFELGDDGTWYLGPGWEIGEFDCYDGTTSARFANEKTKGSDVVSPLIPAKLNDYIRLTGQVQQGGSSKGNAGARVSLIYSDAAGAELQRNSGNLVTSGKDGNWNLSTAEGGAPAGTAGVRAVVSAYRNKQNRPLFVDQIKWNHKYVLGQNDDSYYFLSIQVTDAENRIAYWKGNVEEYGLFLTSSLLPMLERERLGITPYVIGAGGGVAPTSSRRDNVRVTPGIVSFEVKASLPSLNPIDPVLVTNTILSFNLGSPLTEKSAKDTMRVQQNLTVFQVKMPLVERTIRDNFRATPSLQGFTLA